MYPNGSNLFVYFCPAYFSAFFVQFFVGRLHYPRDVVSGVFAAATVCLSVCPSVTAGIVSKQLTKPILKLFRPTSSPIIYAFVTPCADTKFQGEPFIGGVIYTEVGGKNWRFSTDIAVYLGNGAR